MYACVYVNVYRYFNMLDIFMDTLHLKGFGRLVSVSECINIFNFSQHYYNVHDNHIDYVTSK